MARYRLYFDTGASLSIEVEVPDLEDKEEERESAIEEAYQELPSGVCASCSGWGQPWGLDIGDWELSEYNGKPEIEKLDD